MLCMRKIHICTIYEIYDILKRIYYINEIIIYIYGIYMICIYIYMIYIYIIYTTLPNIGNTVSFDEQNFLPSAE